MEILKINMLINSKLIYISKLLNKNGIDFLSFKGPILSIIAYDDIISRRYLDLDILIKEEDLEKVYLLLINNGFSCEYTINYLKNKLFYEIVKDLTFVKENIVIEIHWKLYEKRFFANYEGINKLAWKDTTYITNHNTRIPTFNMNYLVFYLIIHGSKHYWERIEWLINIYNILNKNNQIDFDLIIRYSIDLNSKRMLNVFFILLKDNFNYKFSSKINSMINEDKIAFSLANKILINWGIVKNSSPSINFEEFYFIIAMQDNYINKLKVIYKLVFEIKSYDLAIINLDRKFSFLYYFIRPFRVIYDYIKK